MTYNKIYILDHDPNHQEVVLAIGMSDGNTIREPFLQVFKDPERNRIKSMWVADGYYNKKEYKSYAAAMRAYQRAVGDLALAGFVPCWPTETFRSRFDS